MLNAISSDRHVSVSGSSRKDHKGATKSVISPIRGEGIVAQCITYKHSVAKSNIKILNIVGKLVI